MSLDFTKQMKKEYTIIAPDIFPTHMELLSELFRQYGYKLEVVHYEGKEVIDEEGLAKVLAERTDLKYVTDIAADMQVVLNEKFGNRVFATPKKMGAETQEANVNAALAAANQIVAFFTKGENRFQVNKW